MIAEFLSVGTELLLGEIVDTNSAWLAQDIAQRGVDVYWSRRIGDNLTRISQAVEDALGRADLVVMCGGLGPTDDDMTREAIAHTLGETPYVDGDLETELRQKFARFSSKMPENNLKQAWLIPSATALPNPNGTAPGWFVNVTYQNAPRVIVALPGPPRELKPMWLDEVLPRLQFPNSALFTRTFKSLGLGESMLAERLGSWTQSANPSVATYAKSDGVHVRVAAKADTFEKAKALAEPAVTHTDNVLADYVWGYDDDELNTLIVTQLKAQNHSLGIVEVSTSGLLGLTMASADPEAHVFLGSLCPRTPAQWQQLGIGDGDISAPDAAARLTQAAANTFQSTVGLAITPPTLRQTEHKRGGVAMSVGVYLASSQTTLQQSLSYPRVSYDWLRERAAYAAMGLLWQQVRPA